VFKSGLFFSLCSRHVFFNVQSLWAAPSPIFCSSYSPTSVPPCLPDIHLLITRPWSLHHRIIRLSPFFTNTRPYGRFSLEDSSAFGFLVWGWNSIWSLSRVSEGLSIYSGLSYTWLVFLSTRNCGSSVLLIVISLMFLWFFPLSALSISLAPRKFGFLKMDFLRDRFSLTFLDNVA